MKIVLEWGGLTTGCLGIAGSIFVYFHSDRKLKAQQKVLNDLQLELLSEERADKKKAHLNVECQKRGRVRMTSSLLMRGKVQPIM